MTKNYTNDEIPWPFWVMVAVLLLWAGSVLGAAFQHEFLCDPVCVEQGYDTARATMFVTDVCQCKRTGEVVP